MLSTVQETEGWLLLSVISMSSMICSISLAILRSRLQFEDSSLLKLGSCKAVVCSELCGRQPERECGVKQCSKDCSELCRALICFLRFNSSFCRVETVSVKVSIGTRLPEASEEIEIGCSAGVGCCCMLLSWFDWVFPKKFCRAC